MNLPTRQNKKRNQALDAFASIAKTWSEWRLGERAAQSVATGTKKASKAATKARKRAGKSDSAIKAALKSTPVKIAGAAAVVGGVGAAIAKKLKGGGTAEPLYTPPPAPAPMKPPGELKDMPSPPKTSVKVGDLSGDDATSHDAGAPTEAASEPAVTATAEPAEAASEQAVATAGEPEPDVSAPTVPDTEPETDTDPDITDPGTEVEAVTVSAADDVATTESAVSAEADADELEPAAAGDAHGDDAPTVPADDDKS
jgi:hypothetical protein